MHRLKNSGKPIQILLVDAHDHIRKDVRSILHKEPLFQICGEAWTGETAILQVIAQRPDLVIMGLNISGISGLETTRRLRSSHPEVTVIILAAKEEEPLLLEAIRAGASSYVLKDRLSEQLLLSIRVVSEGGSFTPTHLLRAAVADNQSSPSPQTLKCELLEPLSKKEMEVLACIVHGLPTAEIAVRLQVSSVTVKKRIGSILCKMMVSNQTQAALKAVKFNLVESG